MKARLSLWWQQRKPRERLIIVVAIAVAAAVGVETLVLQPLRKDKAVSEQKLKALAAQRERIDAVMARERSEHERAQAAERAALRERRARAEAAIGAARADLIDPRDTTRQLNALLARFPQLRIVSMSTAAPALVGDAPAPGGAPPPDRPDGRLTNVGAIASGRGLYQHGVELQIEGRFLDLLAYLEALEHAPYRVYWHALDLKVGPQGVPVTRITLYTLSKEPVWLQL